MAISEETTHQNEQMHEILRRVRQIEIRSRRMVNDVLGGEYHSVFKGRGMEFDEVREYAPGDEIRDIDWNVTARMGKPFIKRYVEEREQTVFFVVDVSASGLFGSADRMKGELAAEICSVLAFSAIQNNDRVGLLRFTDKVEQLIPPKRGRKHVLRVVRELLFARPEQTRTDLTLAIDTLNKVLKRKSIVFLVSDFLVPDFYRPLLQAKQKHDLVAIRLEDVRERELPPVGFIELQDAETGESMLVDSSSRSVREQYSVAMQSRQMALDATFKKLGVDNITIQTDVPYLDPLVQFFRRRARRY